MAMLHTKRSAAFSSLEAHLWQLAGPTGAVSEAHGVGKLVELIKEADTSNARLLCLSVLSRSSFENWGLDSQTLNVEVASVLGQWLREHRKAMTPQDRQVLTDTLHCLGLLVVSMELLAETDIGRFVNSLTSCANPAVASEAEALTAKWKSTLASELVKRAKVAESPNPNLRSHVPVVKWAAEPVSSVKYFMKEDEPNAQCASMRPLPTLYAELSDQAMAETFCRKESAKEIYSPRKAPDYLTPRIYYSSLMVQRVFRSTRAVVDSLERSEVHKLLLRTQIALYERESDVPDRPHECGVSELGSVPLFPLLRGTSKQIETAAQITEFTPQYPASSQIFPPLLLIDPLHRSKAIVRYSAPSVKPPNYRTIPCVKYHSTTGCMRGANCHFIHDLGFAGRSLPRFSDCKRSRSSHKFPSYFPPSTCN